MIELNFAFPQSVSAGGEDPKSDPWMVDYSKLTPVLVKAVQELQLQIETLKAENEILKTKNEEMNKGTNEKLQSLEAKINLLTNTTVELNK